MNWTSRVLASANLLWEKREGRRLRRGRGVWVKDGMWAWVQWKKETRVVGWEARVLELRRERRRGSVRWGM